MYEYLLSRSELNLFIIIFSSSLSVFLIRKFGLTPGGVLPSGLFVLLLLRDPAWAAVVLLASLMIYAISRLFLFSSEGLSSVYTGSIVLLLFCLIFSVAGAFLSLVFLGVALAILAALFKFASGNSFFSKTLYDRFNPDLLQYVLALAFAFLVLSIYPVTYLQAGGLTIAPVLSRHYLRNGFLPTFTSFLCCAGFGWLLGYLIIVISQLFGSQAILSLNQGQLYQSQYLKILPYLIFISLSISFVAFKWFKVRAGGYVLAPFAAQLFGDLHAASIILVGVIFCCLFQAYVIERFTFAIGLSRYLYVLVLSSSFTLVVCGQYVSLGIPIFVVANAWILALVVHGVSSDIIVYGKRVLPWIAINFALVYIAFRLIGLPDSNTWS